jgi:hypothetical protein
LNIRSLSIFLTTVIFFGCGKKASTTEKLQVSETKEAPPRIFRNVANFPTIKDTSEFIADLRKAFGLKIHESPIQKTTEKITTFRKVKIFGSDKDYFFVEYDYIVGAMADYPWKFQILISKEGRLVKLFTGQRFDFVQIFPNQNPFLMILNATSKGNGIHEIYRVSADTMQNVLKASGGSKVKTYDAHEDLSVFEPNELKMVFLDINNDGFNDIVFAGQKLMLGKYTKDSIWYDMENGKSFTSKNPAAKTPLKYIFIYNSHSGFFITREKYVN